MEIVTVTSNDRKSIYKILLPDFSLPLDKVSGKILSKSTDSGQRDSVVTLLQELRLPLKCQSSEVVSFWPIVTWNSRAGQMTIFGTQKSLLSNNILHLASLNPNYTASGQGMHRCLGQDHQSTRIIS